jgi:hypothetical protein
MKPDRFEKSIKFALSVPEIIKPSLYLFGNKFITNKNRQLNPENPYFRTSLFFY